jgi:hypothetical protein
MDTELTHTTASLEQFAFASASVAYWFLSSAAG